MSFISDAKKELQEWVYVYNQNKNEANWITTSQHKWLEDFLESKLNELSDLKDKEYGGTRRDLIREIEYLQSAQPYRGKPTVFIIDKNIKYAVQITKAYDTQEGLYIEGNLGTLLSERQEKK